MVRDTGVLAIHALTEDRAHLLWLVEEAIKHGEEDDQDTSYWEGLLFRLKDSVYTPVAD